MEFAAREPFHRLNALLDRVEGDGDHLPPLGHWLCFLPDAPQASLGPDGHPERGGFLPPVPLPMRMWAGSRLTFTAPIPFEREITRRTTILGLKEKNGRTGPLAFLTTRHEIFAGSDLCITEDLDIVFRDRSGAGASMPGERREAQVSRSVTPASTLLFRYSALTFNAHRIHYDRDYATGAEGYPGLVVHGPLLATLLVDHFRRHNPAASIHTLDIRARRPVYDLAPFTVNLVDKPDGADLWAADAEGFIAMSAEVGTGKPGTGA